MWVEELKECSGNPARKAVEGDLVTQSLTVSTADNPMTYRTGRRSEELRSNLA